MAGYQLDLSCPRCEDGEVCVAMEYVPPERGYGSDRDGNRGIDLPGYFSVSSVCTECSNGCVFTEEEAAELDKEAEKEAEHFDPGYDEPDYDPYDRFYDR